MMILGGGALGRWLGLSEVIGAGLSLMGLVPEAERHQRVLSVFTMWGHSKKVLSQARKWAPTRTWSCWHLDLGLPASRNGERVVCCVSHAACCILLQQAEQTDTTAKTVLSTQDVCLLLLAYWAAILSLFLILCSGPCLLYLKSLGLTPPFWES